MKKITTTLAVAIIVLLLFTGCEKINRGQYIGKWDFMERYMVHVGHETVIDTTMYYSGKISRGGTYNRLNIKYSESSSISLNVDENGELFESTSDYDSSVGRFEGNDKILIFLRQSEGMGCAANTTISGVKIERGQQ